MGRGRGRGGNKWRGNRSGGRGGNTGRSQSVRYQSFPELIKKNDAFERYYNDLGIVEGEEKEQFWEALRRELPNSFRFAGSKGHALVVQKRLIDYYIPEIIKLKFNGEPVAPPQQLEWFPNKLAWQMATPKNVVRKHAPFATFQKFLVSETSVGNISRQETVSMIPPLLMDIRPGMTVLDMCAAPGSKSAQLIEMVHSGEEARVQRVIKDLAKQRGLEISSDNLGTTVDEAEEADASEDLSDDGRSTGLLIANDVEYKRAQLLVHQTKRLNSPNIIVTNHDATMFPSIKIPTEPGHPQKYLKFDRILADVPCSGDGTARKNPNVWKDWIVGNGLGLHLTQARILVRALQMLKVGGRVVYSTCSMNPVENEAVISAAIDRCGGNAKVSLVDVSQELQGLKRRDGLNTWKIMDKKGNMWSSWSDVQEALKENSDEHLRKLTESMFPVENSSEEERHPLERCVRVYPHLQDTGGFFIAVLTKLGDIRARPENTPKTAPVPKKTTIFDVVDEMAAQPVDHILNGNPGHLKSLEEFAPSKFENSMSDGSLSATARQNRAATPDELTLPGKRAFEGEDESEGGVALPPSSPKKVKVEHDRMNSVPAPPGAELDIPNPVQIAPNTFLEDKPEKSEEGDISVSTPAAAPVKLQPDQTTKRRPNQPHEEPFKYLSPEHETLQDIFRFYALDQRFPKDRFMVRNAMGEPVKAIYYTSTLCRDILKLNEGAGLKFVHCGVKMFMKQDAQGQDICRWRIQTEGMPIVEAWVGEERVVRLWKRATLRRLLKEMFPKVGGDGWRQFEEDEPHFGERVRDVGMGCCVLRVEANNEEDGFEEQLVLPLWRSMASLNLMLPKEERKAMLLRLYNDEEPLHDHSKDRSNKNQTNGQSNGAHNAPIVPSEPKTIVTAEKVEDAANVTGTAAAAMEIQETDDRVEAENAEPDDIPVDMEYVDEEIELGNEDVNV